MRVLAQTIMRGRGQAIMVVTFLAMLSLVIAPISLLSGAGVALVSLRLGSREGMLVVLASWFASSVLSYLVFTDILPALVFALVLWLPAWLLGLLLRSSRQLALTVEAALLMGLLIAAGFYLFLADPGKYWAELLQEPVQHLLDSGQLAMSQGDADQVVNELANWITGIISTGYFLQLVAVLFIARWWQAMIYNPGGFGEEFRSLSLHRVTVYMAIPFLVLLLLGNAADWIVSLATLFLAAFFLQGLAVVHALLKRANANGGWIVGIYILLLIAMPYMMAVLALTGFSDSWMNFRRVREKSDSEN